MILSSGMVLRYLIETVFIAQESYFLIINFSESNGLIH